MNINPISYFTRLLKPAQADFMHVAGSVCQEEQLTSRANHFVTAYLVLQSVKVDFVKTLYDLFNTKHAAFDYRVKSNPLFFKLDEALQYMHFMGDNNIILKAVVPHMAIEGRFETLHVRPELLKLKHIYGGYTSTKTEHFVINPCFDPSILPLVKESVVYDE